MFQPRPLGTTETCKETIFLPGNGISLQKNRCDRAVHAAAIDLISVLSEFCNQLRICLPKADPFLLFLAKCLLPW